MNPSTSTPALSVIVVADEFPTIRKTVGHLAAQTIADRIELVVVVPRGITISPDEPELSALWGMQTVEIESIRSLSWARAPGIQAARAPVVALTESHAFPQHGWAAAFLAALDEGWGAVGPGVTNANPDRAVSWANLFIDYGSWVEPRERREIDDLPGHNSAYRKEALLELGDELDELLEAEFFLHERLRARGHRLLLEPRARIAHVNVSKLRSLMHERFNTGRRFGGARARTMGVPLRLLYAAASPLIPLVRLPRILRDLERTGRRKDLMPGILPWLLLGLVLSAAGEAVGYLAGPGESMYHLSRIELHKEGHTARGDRLVEIGDAGPA